MTGKPVKALPKVAADLQAAVAHYRSWRVDGKEHLLRKYEEVVGVIALNSDSFSRKHGEVRRAILRQSYYLVYFLAEPERVVVMAVLDGRRNPREIQAIITRRKPSWPTRRITSSQ